MNELKIKNYNNSCNNFFILIKLVFLIHFIPLLCLFANATFAEMPRREFPLIPSPPQSKTHWIAQYIEHNTVPMQIKGFNTTLTLPDVIKYYENWFRLKPEYSRKTDFGNEIFGAKIGVYRVAVKIFTTDKGTSGTLMSAAMYEETNNLAERLSSIGKGFPAPVGSKILSDSITYDPGTRNRVIVMSNQLSVEANALLIREQFVKLGWTLNKDQTIKGGISSTLILRKKDSEIIITIAKSDTETSIVSSQTESD